MKIIEIVALENGAHRNQEIDDVSISGTICTAEGWAVIPDGMTIPDTFPFVDIEVTEGVVTSMTAGVVPVDPEPTPKEKREAAYRTMTHKEDGTPLIEWEEEALTVDGANDLWLKYTAEGNSLAETLTALIAAAKAYIRELYPDETE